MTIATHHETRMMALTDAARALRTSYGRLWRELVAGQLPAERVGGRWFVPAAVIRQRLRQAEA